MRHGTACLLIVCFFLWPTGYEPEATTEQLLLMEERISQLEQGNTTFVTVSFYHPESGGINSDGRPDKTCTMVKPVPGWTVAISTELVKAGWLGHKIYIEGFGVFEAQDRMATGLPGKKIDICIGSLKEALKEGIYTNVLAVRI